MKRGQLLDLNFNSGRYAGAGSSLPAQFAAGVVFLSLFLL
ncbi:hypothetical protein HMPREF1981_01143 [Bacteroides pyogenes F0041]|uniref:Uncharacterized protein n=1 Tax=Bacteroides pyogenes F0041 TaxID=1321819 RepID=U2CN19_9BACE|nr:hypothetical protein HMPREF1981_01143 [Bacteroides pyogenes F0041]